VIELNGNDPVRNLGRFVYIKKGKGKGQYAVIIEVIDQKNVLIADGIRRTFDRPKKKNIQHLQFIDCISPEVRSSLVETGRVTNGKLRYAMYKFVNEVLQENRRENN